MTAKETKALIEKLAKKYVKKKVKVKKFSDEWQPISIKEMVEFGEEVNTLIGKQGSFGKK